MHGFMDGWMGGWVGASSLDSAYASAPHADVWLHLTATHSPPEFLPASLMKHEQSFDKKVQHSSSLESLPCLIGGCWRG